MSDPAHRDRRSTWAVGELRHGILNLADALAQSIALLSLALGVATAPPRPRSQRAQRRRGRTSSRESAASALRR